MGGGENEEKVVQTTTGYKQSVTISAVGVWGNPMPGEPDWDIADIASKHCPYLNKITTRAEEIHQFLLDETLRN